MTSPNSEPPGIIRRSPLTTAEVPSADEQLQARLYTFRDPARERNVIDYYQCFADLSADLVIDFCRTVKEATEGKKLAGAFYGYLMELAWNGGFFEERPESDYSTYQRSGHLGLRKVLAFALRGLPRVSVQLRVSRHRGRRARDATRGVRPAARQALHH